MSQVRHFSQAAENNKSSILERLAGYFTESGHVLEIGSGTGQHAIYLSTHLPHLIWQPTEQPEYLDRLNENLSALAPGNVQTGVGLKVESEWPEGLYRYAFSANVLHIMSADHIPRFFAELAARLETDGLCCLYGPYRYGGKFTTQSNARFDGWLKETHTGGGIRDIEHVTELAKHAGFRMLDDHDMPANNQLLVFQLLSG